MLAEFAGCPSAAHMSWNSRQCAGNNWFVSRTETGTCSNQFVRARPQIHEGTFPRYPHILNVFSAIRETSLDRFTDHEDSLSYLLPDGGIIPSHFTGPFASI